MNEKFKVGIDYGGTKIEGILMDQTGKEVLRNGPHMIKIIKVA